MGKAIMVALGYIVVFMAIISLIYYVSYGTLESWNYKQTLMISAVLGVFNGYRTYKNETKHEA